ncbi:hypothetical protein GYMLUDRAFT_246305 [Collybiopsis luxurians FD-317 M1]|uniref:Uncharacterized protein n=1 Tax=Collybiopsis luxurians FD-317 M1 TaxID=944289 RepID=A0A0D0B4N7_9AGAR|nr:hypothetical protein GYMLUDRAFT_246305 [Collybiopsis luxurians FD-317 M1]
MVTLVCYFKVVPFDYLSPTGIPEELRLRKKGLSAEVRITAAKLRPRHPTLISKSDDEKAEKGSRSRPDPGGMLPEVPVRRLLSLLVFFNLTPQSQARRKGFPDSCSTPVPPTHISKRPPSDREKDHRRRAWTLAKFRARHPTLIFRKDDEKHSLSRLDPGGMLPEAPAPPTYFLQLDSEAGRRRFFE